MPYRSKAQQRKFHALLARGEIDASTVHEFDQATKDQHDKLPEKVKKAADRALHDALVHCGIGGLSQAEPRLQRHLQKVAEIVASNALATFTGARKPVGPKLPEPQGGKIRPNAQGAPQNDRNTFPNPALQDAITQKTLNSGAEKLETGSTLPVTT